MVITQNISPSFLYFCSKWVLLWHYVEKPGKASINSSESVIQVTFITIRWTAPADDGGSPITGYRLILQKDETEIEKYDITDPTTTTHSFRGLERNTNYTVKLFSRNFVFEGNPTVRTIKTKFEGEKSQVIPWLSTLHQSFCYKLRFFPVLVMLSPRRIIRFLILSVCLLLSEFSFPFLTVIWQVPTFEINHRWT